MPPRSEAEWAAPPLFVYGLLRPGERYWPKLAPSVQSSQPARVRGRLFMHASGVYPMFEPADEGWVLGDLLAVTASPALFELVYMEITAGYEARFLDAFPDDQHDPTSALVFCWPWGATHRGSHIPSGDWQER